MKFRDNMTPDEIAKFMCEINEFNELLMSAYDYCNKDTKPMPEDYEDPSDYIGMGWVGWDGRP